MLIAGLMVLPGWLRAQDTAFLEKFALSEDRGAVLRDLVPGTEDWFFFTALHYEQTGRGRELGTLLDDWAKQLPENSARRDQMRLRQVLLNYATDPEGSLQWLRNHLGLKFDHEREMPEAQADLPSALDQSLISREAFLKRNLAGADDLKNLGTEELAALVESGVQLTAAQTRALLGRLDRPDVKGLVPLLAAELKEKDGRAFGKVPVHSLLFLSQLEELAGLHPPLRGNTEWVNECLKRLAPASGEAPEQDAAVREAWLGRLEAFAETLPPAFNSLKARVRYLRLQHDLTQGRVDADRLEAYLKLPRNSACIREAWRREAPDVWKNPADLKAEFLHLPGKGPVKDDEPLIRTLLLRLLAAPEAKPDRWAPWLEDSWLRRVTAEARLTSGAPDAAAHVQRLAPEEFQALRDRTDLDFDPACRERWAPGDEVTLDLIVKNVPQLLVRTFEINTEHVHRTTDAQISTSLNLDGLIANTTETFTYGEAPMQQVRRTFRFPSLNGKRGVWIIEFVGGGKSSRALIRKGLLRPVVEHTSAGTVVRVYDEADQPAPGAWLQLGTQRFTADAQQRILIPFTTEPGEQNAVIGDVSGLTSLDRIPVVGEDYDLAAAMHVPAESIIPGVEATVILRPSLLVNQRPGALGAVEEARLTITSTTHDGIRTSAVRELGILSALRETAATFTVPPRLAELKFKLDGEVKSLITGRPVKVITERTIQVNGTAITEHVTDLHLSWTDGKYFVQELGRNGERRRDRAVKFDLYRRGFSTQIAVTLKTDASGRMDLGELAGIRTIKASAAAGQERRWTLPGAMVAYQKTIQVQAGGEVRIPRAAGAPSGGVSFWSEREGTPLEDLSASVVTEDQCLRLRDLKPGDYKLSDRTSGTVCQIRVVAGAVQHGHVLAAASNAEIVSPAPLKIGAMERREMIVPAPGENTAPDAKPGKKIQQLVWNITGGSPDTRVHVFASHFVPWADAFQNLGFVLAPEPRIAEWRERRGMFRNARLISAEHRYVLERRQQQIYPGNMLPRPQLLLNTWESGDASVFSKVELTDAEDEPGTYGEGSSSGFSMLPKFLDSAGLPPDYSFLAQPAMTSLNLKPDAAGHVSIDAAALGSAQFIRVLALNAETVSARNFSLPAREMPRRDVRLAAGLDPAGHFTRENEVTLLTKDTPVTIPDAASAQFQSYGHLGAARDLLYTLSGNNAQLAEFAFLLQWPGLEAAQKQVLYSKYACHELNFFLSRKDPDFFRAVIRPYLASKRDQTFMDEYLLEQDLSGWLRPWHYRRLNTLERILLARRVKGGSGSTARELSDALAVLPRDAQREMDLFESALWSKALAAGQSELVDSTSRGADGPMRGDYQRFPAVAGAGSTSGAEVLRFKLDSIRLDSMRFDGAKIDEVIAFLRKKSIEFDQVEADPAKKGVDFILRSTVGAQDVTLDLRNPSLMEAIRAVCEQAQMKYRIEPHAVIILPITSRDAGGDMQNRVFDVPPDFLSDFSDTDGEGAADPFASSNSEKPRLSGRPKAEDLLKRMGLDLPAGAVAEFANGKLYVRSTGADLDALDVITENILRSGGDETHGTATGGSMSTENAEQVRALFRKGLGYMDLGIFDEAARTFEQLLAIDPGNTDARRELERAARELSNNYLLAARDHTRAEMLDRVDKLWVSRTLEDSLLREQAAGGRAFYRPSEQTREWAENNYWNLPIAAQTADLIPPSRFWVDFALHNPAEPFVSGHLAEAARNPTEALLALAVLDLPFPEQAGMAKSEQKDGALIFTPAGPGLLYQQAIRPAELQEGGTKLLVSQHFFRNDDRYAGTGETQTDKFVTGEFLTGVVYGAEIVVTNPASTRLRAEVLFQIPRGAIPVLRTSPTQTVPVDLEPFRTQALEFHFYFPEAGKYPHYPVHAGRDGKVAGFSPPLEFNVVDTPSRPDAASWEYLSQQGSAEEVLAWLEQANLHATDLDRIAWRLKDADFHRRVIGLLASRQFYHDTTWSYALLHDAPEHIAAWLQHQDSFVEKPGPVIQTPLLSIDPVERRTWQHLEYSPLVNARAHRLGGKRQILNDKLRAQYEALLTNLTFQPGLSDEDRLGVIYYLLLQDRVEEALAMLAQVRRENLREQLQLDYLTAWCAFSREDLATARQLAEKHAAHPVDKWRAKFAEIASQIAEIEGKAPAAAPAPAEPGRDQQTDRAASADPQFALKLEAGQVRLSYRNLGEVSVNYYPMDLEFLFSANPFVTQDTSRFRNIRPHRTETIALPAGQDTHSFPLPAEYAASNVLVEVTGAGRTQSLAAYANDLDVQISESFGILQVRHRKDKRPLAKVYIKVFAQMAGEDGVPVAAFYKDGYTDLRGKFDYTSLSTDDLSRVQKFSLLILSPDHGGIVLEAKPPAQ